MDEQDKSCILFFVKYLQKGQVKTRLSAELGESITVELYIAFIFDLLSTLVKTSVPFKIFFYPESSLKGFVELLGTRYSYVTQQGEDLGQKMKNAFIQTFAQGYQRVVLIGSDIPDLSEFLIKEAVSSLQTHDAVIGPSLDGGYYLIGFNNKGFLPESFDGISWSSETVFDETLSILEGSGSMVYQLPEWNDIDTFADLKDLVQRNCNGEFRSSRTMSYILGNQKLWRQLSKYKQYF